MNEVISQLAKDLDDFDYDYDYYGYNDAIDDKQLKSSYLGCII